MTTAGRSESEDEFGAAGRGQQMVGLATKVIQDPAGVAIAATTEYDSQGWVVKQGAPGTSGTDAGTQTATY